jgi:hypothetical protein
MTTEEQGRRATYRGQTQFVRIFGLLIVSPAALIARSYLVAALVVSAVFILALLLFKSVRLIRSRLMISYGMSLLCGLLGLAIFSYFGTDSDLAIFLW